MQQSMKTLKRRPNKHDNDIIITSRAFVAWHLKGIVSKRPIHRGNLRAHVNSNAYRSLSTTINPHRYASLDLFMDDEGTSDAGSDGIG
jgi:hypothetical protein